MDAFIKYNYISLSGICDWQQRSREKNKEFIT
jgi:hypothetical protein